MLGRQDWIALAVALLALHLASAKNPALEGCVALPLAALGLAVDGVLSAAGFFIFEGNVWLPPWLMYLWLGFVMCLHRSLQFFTRHWLLAVCGGGVGGALSYWSAERLGAVEFGMPTAFAVAVLLLQWSLLLPVLLFLNHRLRSLFIYPKAGAL